MAIREGYDTNNTSFGGELVGLYYYFLDKQIMKDRPQDTTIFGYVPTIQSITFNPFLSRVTSDITSCNFDVEKFGNPLSSGIPKVYRIRDFDTQELLLKTVKSYDKIIYGEKEETRLLSYPYRYFLLTDYINPPLLIKPEYTRDNGTDEMSIFVKSVFSQQGTYNIFVSGYKGCEDGKLEGNMSSNPLFYPVASSSYSSFLASSGNAFRESTKLSLMENDVTLRQNLQANNLDMMKNLMSGSLGVLGSAISGNVGGVLSSSSDMAFGMMQNKQNKSFALENANLKQNSIETMALAQTKDLINTPRALKSMGNDALFLQSNGERRVDLLEYRVNNHYKNKLTRYFEKYGYKVNKYTVPKLDARKNWNYIKCAKASIVGSSIPYEDLEEIINIFENGITFWQVENKTEMLNYLYDNEEVYNYYPIGRNEKFKKRSEK